MKRKWGCAVSGFDFDFDSGLKGRIVSAVECWRGAEVEVVGLAGDEREDGNAGESDKERDGTSGLGVPYIHSHLLNSQRGVVRRAARKTTGSGGTRVE